MPLPMVHLGVAYTIHKNEMFHNLDLSPSQRGQFYLGSIAPDAIHMRPGSSRMDKDMTHLLLFRLRNGEMKFSEIPPEDVEETTMLLLTYLSGQRHDEDFSFYLGYVLHILTDLYWAKTLSSAFMKAYYSDPNPLQDRRMAYYNDTDQLDFALYQTCSWRREVWEDLAVARGLDVKKIELKGMDVAEASRPFLPSADEINQWNKRTLHWYDTGSSQHKNPIRYMNLEELKAFILEAAEKLWEKVQIW